MSRELKFCGCKCCRAGRHRPGSKATIKRAARKLRHETKENLAKGKEPPDKTSIDYTD